MTTKLQRPAKGPGVSGALFRCSRLKKPNVRIVLIGMLNPLSNAFSIWSICATSIMESTSLTKDFKEFLQCLNDAGVEYLLIGGHAVAFHGYPRATADLDVWIAVDAENARRTVAALLAFGFGASELSPELFLQKDRIIRMGVEPNRIEIQTGISGIEFSDVYPQRIHTMADGISVNMIPLAALKKNKQASGRNKDLADLENLP